MNVFALISLTSLLLCGCQPAATPEAELDHMIDRVTDKFSEVAQLPTAELAAWLNDPKREAPQILDVREPEEFAISHLAGAIQVSPEANAKEVIEIIDTKRPVVVYCSVGYRSSALAQRLIEAGAADVINLEGSIFKWASEGRPMLRDGAITDKAHPYNQKFGRMLQQSLRAYQ